MGEHRSQSDIFRVIAQRWKEMTDEEKDPYIKEVRENSPALPQSQRDHDRYKTEMQQFHKLRREIEKGVNRMNAMGNSSAIKNTQLLQQAFQNRDSFQVVEQVKSHTDCSVFNGHQR